MVVRNILTGFFLSAAISGTAFAADYASCLLETMPGTQSGPAFVAGMQLCSQKHPDQFFTIKRGSGRGILGPKSANACTAEKAKTTSWQPAAHQIKRACDCLYGDAQGEWDMCQRYDLPQEIRQQHPNLKTPSQTLALENHYRRIYAAHPDADEIFNRKDFQAWWLNDPSKAKVLSEGSTQAIIKLMSDFKEQYWGAGDRAAPQSSQPR